MESIGASILLEVLGPEFDDFLILSADGTSGGILLVWQSRIVSITDPMLTTNALTAKVNIASSTPWWITGLRAPGH